jgi:Fe-S-cluster-containing dehydrogenase component
MSRDAHLDRRPGRRRFVKLLLANAAGVCVGSLHVLGSDRDVEGVADLDDLGRFEWGYVVDTTRCIGCGSCVRGCQVENGVPQSYFRTWVERYEIDAEDAVFVDSPEGALSSFPANLLQDRPIEKAFFVPKLCNHCRNSACTQVCPVGASFHSPDGVVLIDEERCVGCGYCVQACPYGCRYITHDRGTADKCTFCYHRIHEGLLPACVQSCPRDARIFGDLRDHDSRIRSILRQRSYYILKPDMGTNPKCYYLGLDLEVK